MNNNVTINAIGGDWMFLRKEWVWNKPIASPDGAGRATVKVENGRIFYAQRWSVYHPLNFPNLPNRLAHAESTTGAVKFVESYGILGYHSLIAEQSDDELFTTGDPLGWFLHQAKTVRFALQIINALQENKTEEQLSDLINNEMMLVPMKVLVKDTQEETKGPAHCFAEGADIVFRPALDREGKHNLIAFQLVCHLININIQNAVRTIGIKTKRSVPTEQYIFTQQFAFRSLIEAIWYMIGDAAVNLNRRGVRICQECGLPFIVTDKRQKFCPGDPFSSGSLCGGRNRIRRYRKSDN